VELAVSRNEWNGVSQVITVIGIGLKGVTKVTRELAVCISKLSFEEKRIWKRLSQDILTKGHIHPTDYSYMFLIPKICHFGNE
jgi:hypothetical protein